MIQIAYWTDWSSFLINLNKEAEYWESKRHPITINLTRSKESAIMWVWVTIKLKGQPLKSVRELLTPLNPPSLPFSQVAWTLIAPEKPSILKKRCESHKAFQNQRFQAGTLFDLWINASNVIWTKFFHDETSHSSNIYTLFAENYLGCRTTFQMWHLNFASE